MTPILAFDIETVPDIAGLRLLHGIDPRVSDRDVAEFAFRERRARTGHDFLPLHQHRVVAIACALRDEDSFRCWSLGSAEESEAVLIRRFFDGIEKYTPQLVSCTGSGFDLPVLHYRSLGRSKPLPFHDTSCGVYFSMPSKKRRTSTASPSSALPRDQQRNESSSRSAQEM